MTFKDIPFNQVFTVYYKKSSKNYEERRAILVEDKYGPRSARLYILSRNFKVKDLAAGKYGSNYFYLYGGELKTDSFSGYFLTKPKKPITIIRKKIITITVKVQ